MTGLPHVQAMTATPKDSMINIKTTKLTNVEDWKVKAVTDFLPHVVGQAAIIQALEQNGGDIDSAVSKLLDVEYISSQSSTPATPATLSSPGSLSIERDSDSDDDVICRPSKRQNRSVEPERSTLKENSILRREETQSSGNLGLGVVTDSGYEGTESPHKSGSSRIKTGKASQKVHRKKRIAKSKAIHASGPITSESEPDSCRLKSNDTVTTPTLVDTSKEKEDNNLDLLAHPTMANINITGGQIMENNEGLTHPSDGEADDEYRPEGEDDVDSDFTPNAAVSATERKSASSSKKVSKHTRKNSKLTKTSEKLLETTIENFNQNNISAPVEKVVGMKVLSI